MRTIMLALLVLSGCATGGNARIGTGEWRVVDINGVPASQGGPPTLRLGADNRVSGNGSCNGYSGTYRTSSDQGIRFTAISSTRMACPEPVMDQERRFHSILENVQGFSFYRDGSLSLVAGDGRAIRLRPN